MSADQPWLDDRDPEPPKSAWEQTKEFVAKQPRGPGWETAMALASGAAAFPISGLAGLAGGASSFLPGGSKGVNWQDKAADWTRATQNALTYEPKSDTAQWNIEKLGYLPEKLNQGADWVGGKVTDITGSPLLGTEANVAIQAIPNAATAILKAAMPRGARPKTLAARDQARVDALTADTAATDAKATGFGLPPSQVNPSLPNRVMEWYAGTGQTADALAVKNQKKAQNMYRSEFDMDPGTKLDKAAYESARAKEQPHYDAVRRYGESAVSDDYLAELANMEGPIKNMASKYKKNEPPPILGEIDSLVTGKIDANAALDKIRDLRKDARKAGSGVEPDEILAAQYWKLSNILEKELDRHLDRVGAPKQVIENYRSARETIAKLDTAEHRTKPSGEVDIKGSAADLQAPFDLTGGQRRVAEFGAQFPTAARLPSQIGSGRTSGSGLKGLLGGDLMADYLASDRFQGNLRPRNYGETLGDRMVQEASKQRYPYISQVAGQEDDARKRAFIELLMKDRQ